MALYWIIAVSFAGGLTSLILASIIFKNANAALTNSMVSLAVGTLLAASFLEIIPHAMEASQNNFHGISFAVLIGILILFILEKLLIWRHCHGSHCHKHSECEVESKPIAMGVWLSLVIYFIILLMVSLLRVHF
jgi:zinc and cadmium transporter